MTVPRRCSRWLLVTVPLAVIAGCTELAVQAAAVPAAAPSTREAQTRPLDGQKTAITVLAQAAPESGELAAALVQIESLRKEINGLQSQLEIQKFELEKLKQRQRDLYDDLDQRLRREERLTANLPPQPGTVTPGTSEGSAAQGADQVGADTTIAEVSQAKSPPVVTSGATKSVVVGDGSGTTEVFVVAAPASSGQIQATTVGVNEEEAYDAAFDLLKQSRYSDAGAAFANFLRRYPDSHLTDDSWYWMGEARYVTREFERSLKALQTVIQHFPESARIPTARLKIGYIQYELGDYKEARNTLNHLLEEFPSHRVAVSAKARLKKMDREGR